DGGHDGDAEIDEAALVADAETAVLGNAALGNIELTHHLDAGKDGGVPFLGERLHGVLEDAVNAVLDGDFGIPGLDMNVTGAALEGGEDDGVDEADNGDHTGIAGEPLHGNVFVALFLVGDDLEGEAFGGLVEDALGLLGALEEVADLRGGGDLDDEFLAQQTGQLIIHEDLARIRDDDDEGAVARFERDEIVTEHQLGRDAADKLGINALLAKIHKGTAVTLGELAGLLLLRAIVWRASRIDVTICSDHECLIRQSLPRRRKAAGKAQSI